MINLKTNGRGNIKAQQQRRKQRLKYRPSKRDHEYELIDGNLTYYPTGYCEWHQAYLSVGLMETHRCNKRSCFRFKGMENEDGN